MNLLLTAAQMRAIEDAAIAIGVVSGAELMERAGRAVVDAIFAEWPELAPPAGGAGGTAPSALRASPPRYLEPKEGGRRAIVLCGPGNNGGDGFVVARLLRDLGWDVAVYLYGDPEKLPTVATSQYTRWCAVGDVLPLDHGTFEETGFPGQCDLVVDALFGTGLRRPVKLPLTALAAMTEAGQKHRVVAVDLPSGICSDSGRALGAVVTADLTVTFHARKLGHVLADGPEHAGRVVVADIGLVRTGDRSHEGHGAVRLVEDCVVPEKRAGHKFDHGHALCLSGGPGRGGAVRLAARGALRIGAGAVTVGCPPAAMVEHAAQLTAVMLRSVGRAEDLVDMLADRRITAVCLGPGLGTGPQEAALLRTVLTDATQRPTLLDADALTILAGDAALRGALHANCVLTPHAGEFARMFPDLSARLDGEPAVGPAYSKVEATRQAARVSGCVVLFKGPDTVIAGPDGACSVHAAVAERAAPWLATAGSGDVLAGFIAGLMARGMAPMQAAETGAWLHAACARAFGPGLIAEDLPEILPEVLRGLSA